MRRPAWLCASLQQVFAWVILEDFSVPDITPQRVLALVPRLIGHLEDRRAPCGGAGQEARAQRVSGKVLRIEAGASGVTLYDVGDAGIG